MEDLISRGLSQRETFSKRMYQAQLADIIYYCLFSIPLHRVRLSAASAEGEKRSLLFIDRSFSPIIFVIFNKSANWSFGIIQGPIQ